MELSPYLQALQRISGSTPGEKRRTLTEIAQQTIKKWNNTQSPVEVSLSKSLAPLEPWVKLEVGRLLKRPDDIIVGLLSDDQTIFRRALKIKWFFKGIGTIGRPNYEFFKNRIFPYISLRNRNKIIKVLADNLTNSVIAESFYVTINELYGLDQARPFLKNCSDLFIWNCINTYKVKLTLKEMIHIYSKSPSFIIQYLYVQNDDEFEDESRPKSHSRYTSRTKVNLRKFLPRLLKNHSADFIKLIRKYGNLDILLKNYKTYLFLKHEQQALLYNPRLYFPMLSLKKATVLLPEDKFMIVFQKFFPEEVIDFKFMDIYNLLEFMPQKKKLPFLLKVFKETYFYTLEDFPQLVALAMKYFPLRKRHYEARRLLRNDRNWLVQSQIDIRRSWRCYLPLSQSLPMILSNIKKSESCRKEVLFLRHLIFACGVNEDFQTMLNALNYISANYKYLEESALIKIFDQVTRGFDLKQYIPLYWEELNKFILNSNVRTGLHESVENIWDINVWGIRMNLERDRDINDQIIVLTEINKKNRMKPIWNILKDVGLFEYICLDKFIEAIFYIYIIHQMHNTDVWKHTVISLVTAMYDFNNRYGSKYGVIFEQFFIKDCYWLKNAVNKLLGDYFNEKDDFDCRELISLIKENEPLVLETFIEKEELCNIPRAIITLRKNFKSIVRNWEIYFQACKRKISKKSSQIFLRQVKWSRHLPRLFVRQCLKELDISIDKRTMKILAILLEGSVFENIITVNINCIQTECLKKKKPYPKTIRSYYQFLIGLAETIKYMNIPFSLVFVQQLCLSDYMPIVSECLTGLERQIPVNILVTFVEYLLSNFNSVAKQAVRVFQNVASSEDLQRLLLTLWKDPDNDVKTRTYLIKHIHHAFSMRPSDSTWKMMLLCLNNLNSEDEVDALDIIVCYRKISNRYIPSYIRNILSVFINIETQLNVSRLPPVWGYVPDIIGGLSVDTSDVFSETLHELTLEHWFANASVSKKVMKNSIFYFVNCYMKPSHDSLIKYRLQFFSTIFHEMLTDYLQKLDNTETVNFALENTFLYEFTNYIIFEMPFGKTKKMLVNATLKSFLAVLTPQHNMEFYCYLKLIDLFTEQISPRQLAEKIDKLLLILIRNFSTSCLHSVSHYLYYLIKIFYSNESLLLDVIECLIRYEKSNNTYLATCLLVNMTISNEKSYRRYCQILTCLEQDTDSLIVTTAKLATKTRLI